jgi:hypothetical protein
MDPRISNISWREGLSTSPRGVYPEVLEGLGSGRDDGSALFVVSTGAPKVRSGETLPNPKAFAE